MEKAKAVQPNEFHGEPYPPIKDVKVGYLLSKRDDKTNLRCLFVRSPKGSRIEKHDRKTSDDSLRGYPDLEREDIHAALEYAAWQ